MGELIKAIKRANRHFSRSANLWEEGNNSGLPAILNACESQAAKQQAKGREILKPFGITVTFPGLYPAWNYKGHTYYTAQSLISWIELGN